MEKDVARAHTHTHTHTDGLSVIEKNEIMPNAATWIDLEIFTLSELSHIEKDKYHMMLLWMCKSGGSDTNEIIYKHK